MQYMRNAANECNMIPVTMLFVCKLVRLKFACRTGHYEQSGIEAACERRKAEQAAASPEKKHNWMHHFATFRQQQAEAAAAAARQTLPVATAASQPHTFKRFLDGHDESAFAQLTFKHVRRSDGAAGIDVASLRQLPQRNVSGGAARTQSDGAVMRLTTQPASSKMSPTEAAVVELFVSASRPNTGPALSAPAQFDERMARCSSEQTHMQPSGEGTPVAERQPSCFKVPPFLTSPFACAALAGGIPGPGPAALDTMESVETVLHPSAGSQPSPGGTATVLPELPWTAWFEQLRIFISGCQALPETGELGVWCADQLAAAVHLAAGSTPIANGMTLEQYMQLIGLPLFAQQLSVIESQVFWECLSRLKKFVGAHGRMPIRRVTGNVALSSVDQEEKELADWSAMQRRLAVRLAAGIDCGQMCRDRVLQLIQVSGWLDVLC
jgi:hypothetical protein